MTETTRICVQCGTKFATDHHKAKTVTCSRSCGAKRSWADLDRAKVPKGLRRRKRGVEPEQRWCEFCGVLMVRGPDESKPRYSERRTCGMHGRHKVPQKTRWDEDPQTPGSQRTVLARTCPLCGLFMSPDRFEKDNRTCRACQRRSAKRNNDAMPQPRGGYQWTGPEMEIAEREDLTAMQAGLMIGRSLYAVVGMRHRIRNEPKLQRVLGAQS